MRSARRLRPRAEPPAISITTGTVSDVIAPDGRVSRTANPRIQLPPAGAWFPGTGTWYILERGHLVVASGAGACGARAGRSDRAGSWA